MVESRSSKPIVRSSSLLSRSMIHERRRVDRRLDVYGIDGPLGKGKLTLEIISPLPRVVREGRRRIVRET